MTRELAVLKRKLFHRIKKFKIDGLISISLVGSFQYAKNLKKVNDIDMVILVNKLGKKNFMEINNNFNDLASFLNNEKLLFVVENRIGPLKPEPVKLKKVVQLHLLIYDIPIWMDKTGITVTFDWVNFNTLIVGKSLKKITKINRFKRKDLLRDLEVTLSNLESRSAYSRVYGFHGGKIYTNKEPIKLSQYGYYEMLCWGIVTSFLNYMRFLNPKMRKDKKLLLKNAKKLLPLVYSSILRTAFVMKSKIRFNRKISRKESNTMKKEAIEFLKFLRKMVSGL